MARGADGESRPEGEAERGVSGGEDDTDDGVDDPSRITNAAAKGFCLACMQEEVPRSVSVGDVGIHMIHETATDIVAAWG